MKHYYLLRKNSKYLPQQKMLVSSEGVVLLSEKEISILDHLKVRPLFEQEVNQLSQNLQNHLREIQCHYPQGIDLDFESNYLPCFNEDALAWLIDVKDKVSLDFSGVKEVLLPGVYFFLWFQPKILDGVFQMTPMTSSRPTEDRDRWILNHLEMLNTNNILELGSGVEGRLKLKIIEKMKHVRYTGLDLNESKDRNQIRGNIFNDYPNNLGPHTVILEEVIEHLEEESFMPLLHQCKLNGSKEIILTTPNREFTELMGKVMRHPDHKFEWSSVDIDQMVENIRTVFKCTVEVESIGRRIKGCSPTWGIIIKFL